jgi:hypothetical protein
MHPQVYETWFSHLQIPVTYFSTQESGRKAQRAFYRAKTAPMMLGCAMFDQFFQMESGRIAFMLRKAVLRNSGPARPFPHRATLARIDAALISATRLSPLTTASEGRQRRQRLPSISTNSGTTGRAQAALHRQHGRMQNIQLVYFVRFRTAESRPTLSL